MKKVVSFAPSRARLALCVTVVALAFATLGARVQRAESWSGIEPLKSRRADVERVLGRPLEEKPGGSGTLRFKVQGGTIAVAFIDSRFVTAHKLFPELEGTVRQLVLQHESSNDSPESLKLGGNSDFNRDARGNVVMYRNLRAGITYTFIDGRLRTTNYIASADQMRRAQRGT